jgi:hypothetical protein
MKNSANGEKEEELKAEIVKIGETMRENDFKSHCTMV